MAATTSYKDYWAYKKVSERYKSKVTKTKVVIYFEDGDVYAEFTLKYDKEASFYFIYNDGELINDELDFYETYDDAVKSCFYYFNTRF